MLVVTLGNCQCKMIRDILSHSGFQAIDIVTEISGATVRGVSNSSQYDAIISSCDVLIHQPKVSDKFNLSLLPAKCSKYSFPIIYNNGLFIMFNWHDSVYNKEAILNLHVSENRAILMLKNMRIDFNCRERFMSSINILRGNEKECLCKVSDFILENYRKERLFYTQNHPSNLVLYYIIHQIFPKLFIPMAAGNFSESYHVSPYEVQELGLCYKPHVDWFSQYAILVRKIYDEISWARGGILNTIPAFVGEAV
jgi:hypothetical protein